MTDAPFDEAHFGDPATAVEFLANLVESSTEYSLIGTDLDGRILLWNEGARRLYGYGSSEAIGRFKQFLHTPEDIAAGLPGQMIEGALADGRWVGTVVRRRKDGSRFTARAVLTPRRDRTGYPIGFLLISEDISEEVRLAAELEETRLTRSLVESAPDAMVIVDPEGRIVLANGETERLFGYDRRELVGGNVEMLIPTRYHDRHPGNRAVFFRAPRPRPMGAGLELWGRRKDETEFPVEVSLSPLETPERTLAIAAIRDVTERTRHSEELQRTVAALEAASSAKDRFLARMSHELRTPLNSILGFSGTLLMELPGPLNVEQRKQLVTVEANGRLLLSIINDLIDLAKIESGKVELLFEPVSGAEVLEDVARSLRPLASAKGLELAIESPEEVIMLGTDRRSLSQILINLANNAIKFTESGSVRLRLERSPAEGATLTRFSVIDTGIGIEDDDQHNLFEEFEQVATSGAQRYEGTGLGLYISRRLAGLLFAEITFESAPGEGSTFMLDFPDERGAG